MGINPDEIRDVLERFQKDSEESDQDEEQELTKRSVLFFAGVVISTFFGLALLFLSYDYVNNIWGLPELSAPQFFVSLMFLGVLIRILVRGALKE